MIMWIFKIAKKARQGWCVHCIPRFRVLLLYACDSCSVCILQYHALQSDILLHFIF